MKDSHRIILAVVLSLVVLVGWQMMMPAPPPKPKTPATKADTAAAPPAGSVRPTVTTQSQGQPATATTTAQKPSAPAAPPAGAVPEKLFTIETELYRATFSSRGGALKTLVLKHYYAKPQKQWSDYYFSREPPDPKAQAYRGFLTLMDMPASGPYSIIFNLNPRDNSLAGATWKGHRQGDKLVFTAKAGALRIIKTFTFLNDSYRIGLKVRIVNEGTSPLSVVPDVVLSAYTNTVDTNRYATSGLQAYVNGKLVEEDISDLEKNPTSIGPVDFVALAIPYFMGAVAPVDPPGAAIPRRQARGGKDKDVMFAGLSTAKPVNIAPGPEGVVFKYMVYYGPKDLAVLDKMGHNLAAAVDFGWFDIIAKPMLAALNFLQGYVLNYGVAIIIITIIVKLIFWPLTRKSYKSMKEMQKLTPQVQKLRERYKDDKQRQQQEIMQLYKTYKVNPMGGCLPMLVQIPVFIAFYKVLGASIELRHAPFMLWINDLSAPDRLFPDLGIPWVGGLPVLTLLMGASMLITQKMTPTTGDSTQAKMMMLMPIIFTFLFINFPSGLVLYWLVNNILGIGQQYAINRKA